MNEPAHLRHGRRNPPTETQSAQVRGLVECPACGRLLGEACLTPGGKHQTRVHGDRLRLAKARGLLAALLVLGLASSSTAGPKDVILPTLYYAALNYADYRTSTDATARGGVELNGTARTLGLAPVKIASTALASAVDVMLQGGKHKSTVWVYRAMVGAILGGVSIHNARVNR